MSYFTYCHRAHFKRYKTQKFLGQTKAEIFWKAKVDSSDQMRPQPHTFEIAVWILHNLGIEMGISRGEIYEIIHLTYSKSPCFTNDFKPSLGRPVKMQTLSNRQDETDIWCSSYASELLEQAFIPLSKHFDSKPPLKLLTCGISTVTWIVLALSLKRKCS